MRLFITRRAARRVRQIGAYVHAHDPMAALEVERAIRDAFNIIAEHPDIGRSIEPGLRRFPVPRLPDLIYYSSIANSHVEIITVNHAARLRQP